MIKILSLIIRGITAACNADKTMQYTQCGTIQMAYDSKCNMLIYYIIKVKCQKQKDKAKVLTF